MKKINIFELLSIGLIILIGCLIISVVAKKMLDMDADFLSAAATLFTGVVAFKLFNSWKDQYKTELFERLKSRIHKGFTDTEQKYDDIYNFILSSKDTPDRLLFRTKISDFRNIVDSLLSDIDFYEKLLQENENLKNEIIIKPESVKTFLIYLLFYMNQHVAAGSYEECLKKMKDSFLNDNQYGKILTNKTFINDDLQKIILHLIDEQEGQ